VSTADEALANAEQLLAKVEAARARLEEADAEQAIEILQELSDLAKQVDAEIERARRSAEADAADS
jgi:hypothetical protein